MQVDELTLAVDTANDATPENEVYSRYEETQNRSTYVMSSHTPDYRNMLVLYRTQPTRAGNFKGVGKTAAKFTVDLDVPGVDSNTTLTAPGILEISFSIPVGATTADVIHLRQKAIALLDNDTFMNKLNLQLMV